MMKQIVMVAGALALASAGPALAKPGKGHGKHGNPHVSGQYLAPGLGACPPGLAKKMNGCMPPGQAKKLFAVGQRVPLGYNGLLGYNSLPYDLRSHYGPQLDPRSHYVYDNSYIYRVDPRTMLVQQILNAVLRPY